MGLEDPGEAERRIRLETESAEYQDRIKKQRELEKKDYEAGMTSYRAEKEVEFAEEGLKAARLGNLGETVKRATLIKVAQEEVRSTHTQFEEAKESTEKNLLKGKVLSALASIPCIKRKIKRHNVSWNGSSSSVGKSLVALAIPRKRAARAGRREPVRERFEIALQRKHQGPITPESEWS